MNVQTTEKLYQHFQGIAIKVKENSNWNIIHQGIFFAFGTTTGQPSTLNSKWLHIEIKHLLNLAFDPGTYWKRSYGNFCPAIEKALFWHCRLNVEIYCLITKLRF